MSILDISPTRRNFNMVSFCIMLISLPFWVWFCLISVIHYNGSIVFPDAEFWSHIAPPNLPVLLFYSAWLILQAAMFHFLPGKLQKGQPLDDGSRLDYTLNGLKSFSVTIGLWAALHFSGILPGSFVYANIESILTTANLIVFPMCFYIFFLGRSQATKEEKEMNALEAFFLGAARNPRNGSFDWKFFCESRPGLTLWVVIALSCCAYQYETFGAISNSMILSCFFISLYIVDYYVVEDAILTTWDIVHEPFGWMLCWGSLVYLPFFYPLAAIWLAANPYDLPIWAVAGILTVGLTGYTIFRQSNIQKHRFRQGANMKVWGKEPEFIQTSKGTKLLTSGWWGIASHANYLGDLLLSLAMALVVGGNTIFAYGYFLSFVVLLIHRDWRDNKHCADKYGEDWVAYRKKVRWHIIPGIY